LCNIYGVDAENVSVVPIGSLSGYVKSDRSPDNEGTSARCVLFFGRLERYKGLDVLLDVVPRVRKRFPAVRFDLIGPGAMPALVTRASSLPGVRVVNRWVDDEEVADVFEHADMIVLPYTTATQSGVIPVAAAFGLPVIASDIGGLREQLADGRCGVLVGVRDREALENAIVELLDDPNRARVLGEALRDEYRTSRSWDVIAAAVTRACEAAIANVGPDGTRQPAPETDAIFRACRGPSRRVRRFRAVRLRRACRRRRSGA
jgi:glycosyltransferase involved in cell wall biosynthesis